MFSVCGGFFGVFGPFLGQIRCKLVVQQKQIEVMSGSAGHSETNHPSDTRSGGRKTGSIVGFLFTLFAIEFFAMGIVIWAFLVNRHSFLTEFGNVTDLVWGLITVVSAAWGSWFLVQSRRAAMERNIAHSTNLLAIAIGSAAIVIGILLLNITTQLVGSPKYMDVRSQFPMANGNSDSAAETSIAGNASDGKKWFGMSCVTCHGPTGAGVPNAAPSLLTSDFLKTADDRAIATLIRNGRAANDPANKSGKVMPAKGGNPFLDESKIADLVAFLKDLDSQSSGQASLSASSSSTDFSNLQAQFSNQPAKVVRKWKMSDLKSLKIVANEESVSIGMKAFVKATCNKCHMAAVAGQELGPTLDQIALKYSREKLLQHMLEPSAEIGEKFQSHQFLLMDGSSVSGLIVKESDEKIELMTDLLKPKEILTIPKEDIDEQVKSKVSAMPTGLLDVLTEKEIAGLVAYVDTVGNQMAASNAPQLNRWVVPSAPLVPGPSNIATTTVSPLRSFGQTTQTLDGKRYQSTLSWLFVAATAVLAIHFLCVFGSGTAIVLRRELQLSLAVQIQLAQQTVLFWSIGIVWLVLWFLLFFLIG